jgi:hypothetical protein
VVSYGKVKSKFLKKIAGGIGHTLSPYPIRFLSNEGLEEDHTLPQSFQAALDPLPLCTTRARAIPLKSLGFFGLSAGVMQKDTRFFCGEGQKLPFSLNP